MRLVVGKADFLPLANLRAEARAHLPTKEEEKDMKSDSKNRKMSIRISQKDLDRIHALADRYGQSLTDYVTACCLRKKIIVVEGIEEAFRQLKAIGNNLNQLTALCHMKRIQCADLKEFTEEFRKLNTQLAEILRRKRWSDGDS